VSPFHGGCVGPRIDNELRLDDALFPQIWTGPLELSDEVDTRLRVQIDDVNALPSEPLHTALGVHGVAHDHLAKTKLIDQAGATSSEPGS
jgi:hypothetical protein